MQNKPVCRFCTAASKILLRPICIYTSPTNAGAFGLMIPRFSKSDFSTVSPRTKLYDRGRCSWWYLDWSNDILYCPGVRPYLLLYNGEAPPFHSLREIIESHGRGNVQLKDEGVRWHDGVLQNLQHIPRIILPFTRIRSRKSIRWGRGEKSHFISGPAGGSQLR